MQLMIPNDTVVFRRVRDGNKSSWHLLKKTVPNGFTPKTHPDEPTWWDSVTHVAICDFRFDTRRHLTQYDGTLDFSTVEEVKSVCPSCYPYDQLEKKDWK